MGGVGVFRMAAFDIVESHEKYNFYTNKLVIKWYWPCYESFEFLAKLRLKQKEERKSEKGITPTFVCTQAFPLPRPPALCRRRVG